SSPTTVVIVGHADAAAAPPAPTRHAERQCRTCPTPRARGPPVRGQAACVLDRTAKSPDLVCSCLAFPGHARVTGAALFLAARAQQQPARRVWRAALGRRPLPEALLLRRGVAQFLTRRLEERRR